MSCSPVSRSFLPKDALWFSSNLKRTHQTAAAIWAAGFPQPDRMHQDKAFAEQDLGEWQGMNAPRSSPHVRPRSQATGLRPRMNAHRAARASNDLFERTTAAVARISAEHAGRDIVCVSHGGPIKAAIAYALGLEAGAGFAFTIDNCSVTRLDYLASAGHSGWRVPMIKPAAVDRKSRPRRDASAGRTRNHQQARIGHDPEKWVPVFGKRSCSISNASGTAAPRERNA